MSSHSDISLPLTPGEFYHIYNRGNEKRLIFFERGHYFRFLQKLAEYMKGYVDFYAYALLPNHFHLCIEIKSTEEIINEAKKTKFLYIDSLFKRRYVMSWLMKERSQQNIKTAKTERENDIAFEHATRLTVPPIWNEQLLLKHLPKIMEYSLFDLVELLNELPEQDNKVCTKHASYLEELSPERQLVSYLVSERFRRFLLSHARYINETRGRTGSLFQKAFRRKHLFDPSDVKSVITYINHNPIHHGIGGDYNSYDWTSYKSSIHNYTSLINKTKLWTLFSDVSGFIEEHKRYQQHRWENERYYIEEV
ncbi:MAG: hypothetical protein KA340_09235 [Saprospiraceae bacterium]|jgi:putative transposase|nr:hypothetical protein [Saprospiraceae bacterium]